jgi:hypothetical protein
MDACTTAGFAPNAAALAALAFASAASFLVAFVLLEGDLGSL